MIAAKRLRIPDFLDHISEAIQRIEQYTANMTRDAFERDHLTQDAVYRNFEIIGEAANNIKQLDATFWDRHPHVDFRQAYAMRNALSHGYFTVNTTLVWETIRSNLPAFKRGIEQIRRDIVPV
jgi:uncharacterized protein with HEPN domain